MLYSAERHGNGFGRRHRKLMQDKQGSKFCDMKNRMSRISLKATKRPSSINHRRLLPFENTSRKMCVGSSVLFQHPPAEIKKCVKKARSPLIPFWFELGTCRLYQGVQTTSAFLNMLNRERKKIWRETTRYSGNLWRNMRSVYKWNESQDVGSSTSL